MQARLLTCSESISIDTRRNSVSLFHLLEQFNSPFFPTVVPQMSIFMLIERSSDEPSEPTAGSLRIVLNEQELYRGPIELRFGEHLTAKYVSDVRGLVIPQPGLLRFIVTFGEQHSPQEWSVPIIHIGQALAVQAELPMNNQPAHVPYSSDVDSQAVDAPNVARED
jgi:hypothetical protein